MNRLRRRVKIKKTTTSQENQQQAEATQETVGQQQPQVMSRFGRRPARYLKIDGPSVPSLKEGEVVRRSHGSGDT